MGLEMVLPSWEMSLSVSPPQSPGLGPDPAPLTGLQKVTWGAAPMQGTQPSR